MTKKILLILLAVLLAFTIVACKSGDTDTGNKESPETTKEATDAAPTEEAVTDSEDQEPTTIRFSDMIL